MNAVKSRRSTAPLKLDQEQGQPTLSLGCLQFSDAQGTLEFEARTRTESPGRLDRGLSLHLRVRSAGMVAQTVLDSNYSDFHAWFNALINPVTFRAGNARLVSSSRRDAVLHVRSSEGQRAGSHLSINGPCRDARLAFVLDDWQVDADELVRLREWCGAVLGLHAEATQCRHDRT